VKMIKASKKPSQPLSERPSRGDLEQILASNLAAAVFAPPLDKIRMVLEVSSSSNFTPAPLRWAAPRLQGGQDPLGRVQLA
jgi:hypothetical protein